MVGAANALHEAFDVFGGTDLDHQIDIAPVDAKVQGSGADHGAQLACDHRGLYPVALFAGEAAVVDGDGQVFGIRKPEVTEEQLGLGAGVVEDQGGLVAVYFVQDGGDSIAATAACPRRGIVGLQHGNIGVGAGVGLQDMAGVGVAGEEFCQRRRVFHRGGQADPAQGGGEGLQARQAEHQLVAAFGFGEGVNLIDDDAFQVCENAGGVVVAE